MVHQASYSEKTLTLNPVPMKKKQTSVKKIYYSTNTLWSTVKMCNLWSVGKVFLLHDIFIILLKFFSKKWKVILKHS